MDLERPLVLKLKINSGSDCAVAVVGEQLGDQNVLGIHMGALNRRAACSGSRKRSEPQRPIAF